MLLKYYPPIFCTMAYVSILWPLIWYRQHKTKNIVDLDWQRFILARGKRGVSPHAHVEREACRTSSSNARGETGAPVPLPSASQLIVLRAHVPNSKARQRALNTNQAWQSYFITGFNSCDTKSDTRVCCDFFVLSVYSGYATKRSEIICGK